MSESIVAQRYANALFQIGREKGTETTLVEELVVVKQAIEDNAKVIPFLQHPRVSNHAKKQFLDNVFGELSKEIVNTLKLLIQRGHADLIVPFVDEFKLLINNASGLVEATAYSVRPLSEEQLAQISQTFAKRLNKNDIKFENKIDPSILGGIKVRMGNTIYDGTVRRKLSRIERSIAMGN